MNLSADNLIKISKDSLADFFKAEINSILADVSERNLCSRLAMQFEHQIKKIGLTGYYADTEYNRKQQGQIKTIMNGEHRVISITCDLIIHSRGESVINDNLIAIEMAKPNKSLKDAQDDRVRLIAMTKDSYDDLWSNDGKTHPEHVCGYVVGIFLLLDRHTRQAKLEWYAHGALVQGPIQINF